MTTKRTNRKAPTFTRECVWPSRAKQGLSRASFFTALARAVPTPAQPIVTRKAKPIAAAHSFGKLSEIINAAVRLVRAVGLPEMMHPDAKGSTLIEVDRDNIRGLDLLRLTHRVNGSRNRLEEAGEALADLMAAIGRPVLFREVGTSPSMGGWRVTLRLANVLGATLRTSTA